MGRSTDGVLRGYLMIYWKPVGHHCKNILSVNVEYVIEKGQWASCIHVMVENV